MKPSFVSDWITFVNNNIQAFTSYDKILSRKLSSIHYCIFAYKDHYRVMYNNGIATVYYTIEFTQNKIRLNGPIDVTQKSSYNAAPYLYSSCAEMNENLIARQARYDSYFSRIIAYLPYNHNKPIYQDTMALEFRFLGHAPGSGRPITRNEIEKFHKELKKDDIMLCTFEGLNWTIPNHNSIFHMIGFKDIYLITLYFGKLYFFSIGNTEPISFTFKGKRAVNPFPSLQALAGYASRDIPIEYPDFIEQYRDRHQVKEFPKDKSLPKFKKFIPPPFTVEPDFTIDSFMGPRRKKSQKPSLADAKYKARKPQANDYTYDQYDQYDDA